MVFTSSQFLKEEAFCIIYSHQSYIVSRLIHLLIAWNVFIERLQYRDMVGLLLELQRLLRSLSSKDLFCWPHVEHSHFVTVTAKLGVFCFCLFVFTLGSFLKMTSQFKHKVCPTFEVLSKIDGKLNIKNYGIYVKEL